MMVLTGPLRLLILVKVVVTTMEAAFSRSSLIWHNELHLIVLVHLVRLDVAKPYPSHCLRRPRSIEMAFYQHEDNDVTFAVRSRSERGT